MNTEQPEGHKSKKLVTLRTWAWIFGVFFLVGGVGLIVSNPGVGIFSIIAGIALLPSTPVFVEEKWHRTITRNERIIVAAFCLIIMGSIGVAKTSAQSTAMTSVPVNSSATSTTVVVPTQAVTEQPSAPVKEIASVPAKVATPAPAATAAPAPAYVPSVLLDVSGEGTKSTQSFTTPGDWSLTYTYDCSNFEGDNGNFQVYINEDNGEPADLVGPNELGSGGTDTDYYHEGGTYYLEMNSECSWHVTVKG